SAVQRDAEDVGVREVVVRVRNDVGGAVGVLREVNDDGPDGRPGEDVGDGGGDGADGGVVAVGDAQAVAGAGGVVGVVDQRLAGAVEGGGGGGGGGHFCFLPWWLAVWLYCKRPPAVPSSPILYQLFVPTATTLGGHAMTNHIQDFLQWAERDRLRSPATIKRYQTVLAQIPDPLNATVEDIEAWWTGRYDKSAATRQNELACLRTFYKWATRFDHRVDDPTRRLDAPKVDNAFPRPIGRSDLKRALDACD